MERLPRVNRKPASREDFLGSSHEGQPSNPRQTNPSRFPGFLLKPLKRTATFSGVISVVLVLIACGGSKKQADAPVLARVDATALGTLVQGVDAAKRADTRDKAIELLKQAIARAPDLWEAHYNLGVLYARKNQLALAEPELARARELAPNAEDVALALAEVRRRGGEPGGAADTLDAFVKAFPDATEARMALVVALRESGKVDQAIKEAREVLKRHPSDGDALAALALAHLERGEMDTADLISTESLKAERKTAAAERTAGLVSLKKGDDAVAFQHFARASELDRKETTARQNMGVVLLQAGVYPRAEKEFRAVIEVEPENDEATLGLAAALRGQGKRDNQAPYREAEKQLKSILSRDPSHLAATFNLAVLYAEFMVKPDDARPLFKKYLDEASSKDPGRAIAEKFLTDNKPGAGPKPDAAPAGATPAAGGGKKPSAQKPGKKK
jgi:tetratricopeptide (TPR) repeat protein